MTIHRIRLSDEEIQVIYEALSKQIVGMIPADSPKKLIALRTEERFMWMHKQKIYSRPRRKLYHKNLIQAFHNKNCPNCDAEISVERQRRVKANFYYCLECGATLSR